MKNDKDFYSRFFKILIPILIQFILMQCIELVDNVMLGSLGTLPLTGVTIVNKYVSIFYTINYGLMSGVSIYITQFFGANDQEGVRNSFKIKTYFALILLVCGIFFFKLNGTNLINNFLKSSDNSPEDIALTLKYGLQYLDIVIIGFIPYLISHIHVSSLKESGNTFIPMLSSILALVLNVFLNYCLIFGNFGCPALGVVGAAYATLVARFVECAISTGYFYLFNKNPLLKDIYHRQKFDFSLLKNVIVKGAPLLVNEFLWSYSLTLISQCYSTRGLETVAVLNIVDTINYLFMIGTNGLGSVLLIIIGQELGSGNKERAIEYDSKITKITTIVGAILGLILFFTAPFMPELYNVEPEVKLLAGKCLQVCSIFIPLYGLYYCCYYTLKAGGNTIITMFFDCGYNVAILVPAAYIASKFTTLSLLGIFIIIKVIEVPKSFLGLWLVKKGVWINNLVEN